MKRSDNEHLAGGWRLQNGNVVEDDVAREIRELVRDRLVQVCLDPDNWRGLYKDPSSQEYWELTYPKSDIHGGGPPALEKICVEEARKRYGSAAVP